MCSCCPAPPAAPAGLGSHQQRSTVAAGPSCGRGGAFGTVWSGSSPCLGQPPAGTAPGATPMSGSASKQEMPPPWGLAGRVRLCARRQEAGPFLSWPLRAEGGLPHSEMALNERPPLGADRRVPSSLKLSRQKQRMPKKSSAQRVFLDLQPLRAWTPPAWGRRAWRAQPHLARLSCRFINTDAQPAHGWHHSGLSAPLAQAQRSSPSSSLPLWALSAHCHLHQTTDEPALAALPLLTFPRKTLNLRTATLGFLCGGFQL